MGGTYYDDLCWMWFRLREIQRSRGEGRHPEMKYSESLSTATRDWLSGESAQWVVKLALLSQFHVYSCELVSDQFWRAGFRLRENNNVCKLIVVWMNVIEYI